MDNSEKISLTVCIDCTKNFRSSILEQLLSENNSLVSSPTVEFSDKISVYPWRLDTKYYSVDLGLCKLTTPTVGTADFADRVEAVLFHADTLLEEENTNLNNCLISVNSWLSFVKHWEPSVKVLIFDQVSSTSAKLRNDLLLWCVKNEFELVELNPDEEVRQEAEDCGEVVGVRRIMQILKAHSWANLQLKDENVETQERSKRLQELLGDSVEFGDFVSSETEVSSMADDETHDLVKKLTEKLNVKELEASKNCPKDAGKNRDAVFDPENYTAAAAFTVENAEKETSFEELFEKFATFKSNADNLPPDQRKAYAEKVTFAFWRAIGGDEEEIKGFSSDEEENEAEI